MAAAVGAESDKAVWIPQVEYVSETAKRPEAEKKYRSSSS